MPMGRLDYKISSNRFFAAVAVIVLHQLNCRDRFGLVTDCLTIFYAENLFHLSIVFFRSLISLVCCFFFISIFDQPEMET